MSSWYSPVYDRDLHVHSQHGAGVINLPRTSAGWSLRVRRGANPHQLLLPAPGKRGLKRKQRQLNTSDVSRRVCPNPPISVTNRFNILTSRMIQLMNVLHVLVLHALHSGFLIPFYTLNCTRSETLMLSAGQYTRSITSIFILP